MKLEDYGYNRKTMLHSKVLSRAESVFIGILWIDHQGKGNKISARDFAIRFAEMFAGKCVENKRALEYWKRQVRWMQNHLLDKHDGIPVYSKPGKKGGYWLAESEEEANEFYYEFRKRGLTGLHKGTRGKKAAVVEVVKQIAFEFDDIADKTEMEPGLPAEKRPPMAPDIVDALLAKMTRDPEKFAPNLRKIREKFFSGAILLEKKRLEDMQAKVRGVMADLEGLTG